VITPLGQIAGVPDELIKALNERFRQVSSSSGAAAIAGGRQTRIKSYPASGQNPGDFFVEMDRGNALYQVQVGKWLLVSGEMAGALAKRPTDLNSGDAGFIYRATDTYQEFRWSGSAWVETTAGNYAQIAFCNAQLTLTTSFLDVPNATLTLARAGRHLIAGNFCFKCQGLDAGDPLGGQLVADGVAQSGNVFFAGAASGQLANVSQQWLYTATAAGKVVKLQAKNYTVSADTSIVSQSHTSISALWIGP
jgi:hypothetical protein